VSGWQLQPVSIVCWNGFRCWLAVRAGCGTTWRDASSPECFIASGKYCRATAVAARYLRLDCHLILRNSRALADGDPGLVGNLLVDRMAGAHIWQVSVEEQQRYRQCSRQLRGLYSAP